jgi:DNA repair protein RadC
VQYLEQASNADLLSSLAGKAAAESLLQKFGGLTQLAQASFDQLTQIEGIGQSKAKAIKSAFLLAQRLSREAYPETPYLDQPEKVADFLREETRLYEVEYFHVLLLNTRRRLIRVEQIAKGTLDTVLVCPREVFKGAIAANAAAIVLVHNHPSGDPSPSEADIKVTRDLIRAGQLLKIDVIDHVILGRRTEDGRRDWASLRELGYFAAF